MRTRLIFPARFKSEARTNGVIRDNNLFNIGAQAVDTGTAEPSPWRIVIDTAKPDVVCRYLAQRLPGVEWQRTELT